MEYYRPGECSPEKDCLGDIDWRFDNLSRSHHQSQVICVTLHKSLDSDDDFRSGCWNVILKLINNSSSLNKGNHNREGGLDTRS